MVRFTVDAIYGPPTLGAVVAIGYYQLYRIWWAVPAALALGLTVAHVIVGLLALTITKWNDWTGRPKPIPKPNPVLHTLPLKATPSLEDELWFSFQRTPWYRLHMFAALLYGIWEAITQKPARFTKDDEYVDLITKTHFAQYLHPVDPNMTVAYAETAVCGAAHFAALCPTAAGAAGAAGSGSGSNSPSSIAASSVTASPSASTSRSRSRNGVRSSPNGGHGVRSRRRQARTSPLHAAVTSAVSPPTTTDESEASSSVSPPTRVAGGGVMDYTEGAYARQRTRMRRSNSAISTASSDSFSSVESYHEVEEQEGADPLQDDDLADLASLWVNTAAEQGGSGAGAGGAHGDSATSGGSARGSSSSSPNSSSGDSGNNLAHTANPEPMPAAPDAAHSARTSAERPAFHNRLLSNATATAAAAADSGASVSSAGSRRSRHRRAQSARHLDRRAGYGSPSKRSKGRRKGGSKKGGGRHGAPPRAPARDNSVANLTSQFAQARLGRSSTAYPFSSTAPNASNPKSPSSFWGTSPKRGWSPRSQRATLGHVNRSRTLTPGNSGYGVWGKQGSHVKAAKQKARKEAETKNETTSSIKPDDLHGKTVMLPNVADKLQPGEKLFVLNLSFFDDSESYGGVYIRGVVARFARKMPEQDVTAAAASPHQMLDCPTRAIDITIVGNGTFTPEDGSRWDVAKTYVLQACTYCNIWVAHSRTHLPLDSVCAISLAVLPQDHVVYKLIAPHTRHTLALEDALFTGPVSPIFQDDRIPLTTWTYPPSEHLKALSYGSRNYLFNERITELRRLASEGRFLGIDYLLRHYDLIHAFVVEVLDLAEVDPANDLYLPEWERQISDCVPGFPIISDADTREKARASLAQVVATYMFEVSVRHAYDHHGQYFNIPVQVAPLRIGVPPPTIAGVPRPVKAEDLCGRLDRVKYRIIQEVFCKWARNLVFDESMRHITYNFDAARDPKIANVCTKFRDDLLALDAQLAKEHGKWHLPLWTVPPSIQF